MRSLLPKCLTVILSKSQVFRYQRCCLNPTLSNEQPIKRVFVMPGQLVKLNNVGKRNGKNHNSIDLTDYPTR
jgi:hypothetical protein